MSSGAPQQPETYLRVQDPEGKQLQVPLDDRPILIGRADDAHLQLRTDEVLDHHAEIYLDPFGQWWLRNLGSADKLSLNDEDLHRDEVLESGDQFVIGSFQITYIDQTEVEDAESEFEEPAVEAEQPVPAAASNAPSATNDSEGSGLLQSVPLDLSRQDPKVKTKRIAPIDDLFGAPTTGPTVTTARIDTIHLSTLSEFGHRLLETPESSERLRMLCRLMVRSDFHGQAAVGIRLVRGNSRQEPGKLCTPQSAQGGSQMPHISKGLLHSLLKSGSPGFATIRTKTGSMAAVACAIRKRDRYLDLLYVTVPAEYGTQEWLALIALAAQQYEQAETTLKLRKQLAHRDSVDQEIEAAATLHRRLIPNRPVVSGLDVAIGFRPCHQIGGDYVDAIAIDRNRALSAALITSTLHTLMHTGASADLGLETLMTALNRHLIDFMEEIPFVSLCAIEIHSQTGVIRCINAGHPPALVVDADGSFQRLQEGQNTPLGLADEPFQSQEHRLKPGQMLGLYTYGVIEQANRTGVLGIDQLAIRKLNAIFPTSAPSSTKKWMPFFRTANRSTTGRFCWREEGIFPDSAQPRAGV